ncbi:MAG: DUF5018 domain-containing protein, partial [Prevotellaceae bacterium]|nr:DUF5018 domain-containing protein [Prevotellaceae bacterium]
MRNYRNYFRSIMVALLGSAVFFASCKDDDVETKSAECSIVSFKVNNAEWTIDGTSITHTFSSDFLETNLTPTIEVSEGATVNPASGVAQNFFAESGVKYTVTAEDGKTTKTYTVKATITPSTACEVLEFKTISGRDTVKWVVSGNTITGVYPAGTDTSASLTPTIEISLGATVNPASGVAQKFFTEQGVTYTVTAGDGVTAKTYVAKATVALSTDCYILEFKIGSGAAWAITGDSLITFEYPAGTATENLTPAILISPDAAITPAAGVAQNFFAENGVAYTVTARDGVTTRTYVVKATVALYTGSDILSFVAGDSTWTINADNNTITVVYPTGTDLTALTPTITLSPGATVSPESGVAQDFSVEGGVKYTVTAQDGTVKEYTATATTTAALSSACDVTSFSVGDKTWTIDGTNITVEYPAGADLTALTPTITLSPGATVSPESGVAQDFSAADGVAYTVTAEDGTTTKIYTAKATVAAGPSSACDILSFVVDNEEWGIFEDQIYKPYPAGTEPFSSTPTIVLSEGATVSPESSVAQNFFAEDGVQYTVTAADGTTQKTYTVKATIAAP